MAGTDASFVLDDGRVLEYWAGGDPGGRGIFYHPGTPVTRLLGQWGHDAAVAAGVRLVAINRPGYGGSTPVKDVRACLLGVGRDTAALATHLGLDEYGVFGSSGGGPFAVATAAVAPDAVSALGVVGGIGPWRVLDDPEANAEDRECLALLDAGDAQGAWACLAATDERARGLTPSQFVDAIFDGDASSLASDQPYRDLWAENCRVVQAGRDGQIFDNIAWGGTWDVDPREVVAPTLLFYGSSDAHCPADRHGAWYADRIAGSKLVVVPSAGHLDVIDAHWPEVLAGLLDIWREPIR
jgi:pimeloyl-ACP methyl ester carboxylesterase